MRNGIGRPQVKNCKKRRVMLIPHWGSSGDINRLTKIQGDAAQVVTNNCQRQSSATPLIHDFEKLEERTSS